MTNNWFQRLITATGKTPLQIAQVKAEGGDAEAQFGLGLKYASGAEGSEQDYEMAAQWYRKAAEQNHMLAQVNLGVMYAAGQGLEQDGEEAARWFERAARHGDASAQFRLGMIHRRASLDRKAVNPAESRIEAYTWLHLAAAQGYEGSVAACELVNLHMSWQDVELGNQRADAIRAATPARSTARL